MRAEGRERGDRIPPYGGEGGLTPWLAVQFVGEEGEG